MPKHNKRNRQPKKKRSPGIQSQALQLNKQLREVDMYVIDYIQGGIPDTANSAFDLYTQINTTTDYTNLVVTYGELAWMAVSFTFVPFLRNSALSTDYATGCFGVRQGIFDVTVSTKSVLNVARLPGSIDITNRNNWIYNTPIVHNEYFSATDTNTAQSEVPKVNYYFGLQNAATTNTALGFLHVRLSVKAKSKIE